MFAAVRTSHANMFTAFYIGIVRTLEELRSPCEPRIHFSVYRKTDYWERAAETRYLRSGEIVARSFSEKKLS